MLHTPHPSAIASASGSSGDVVMANAKSTHTQSTLLALASGAALPPPPAPHPATTLPSNNPTPQQSPALSAMKDSPSPAMSVVSSPNPATAPTPAVVNYSHLAQTVPVTFTGKVPSLRSAEEAAAHSFDSNNPYTFSKDAVYILDIKTLESLHDQDGDGTCDPFVKIWLDGSTSCVRTPRRQGTLEPMWVEHRDMTGMIFPFQSEQVSTNGAWNGNVCLHFECWDEDSLFNDFIGYGRLPLSLGTIAPYIRFRNWARAECFVVQLWDKRGRAAGQLSVRLSHVMLHNFVDRWVTNYCAGLLYVPLNQRMTSTVPFSALSVPEQPAILRELLQNVSNRVVRSWLAAPSSVYSGRSIIAALLLIHGALPTPHDEAEWPIPATLDQPPVFGAVTDKRITSGAAANNSGNGAAQVPRRPALSGLPIPPLLRSPSQAPNLELESIFMKVVSPIALGSNALDSKIPIGSASSAGASASAAASGAALSSIAPGAGVIIPALQPLVVAAPPNLTFKLTTEQRLAAQRDPNSAMTKQVNSLLSYLFSLLSVEHVGNNLCYGNRLQHRTTPISDTEIKQNTICYFAFLTRVVAGGGWESLLNPERWAGSVVAVAWSLVFSVPAFQRVDWNDEKNDPLCQSLLDSVKRLIYHNEREHTLKSMGELDVHTDCFGCIGLRTTFGDAADSNPYAIRVRRATSAQRSKHDKVFRPADAKTTAIAEMLSPPVTVTVSAPTSVSASASASGSAASRTTPTVTTIDVSVPVPTSAAPGTTSAVISSSAGSSTTSTGALVTPQTAMRQIGEAALQATLAAVNTDIGSTTPIPSIDEAKRLALRLSLYNSPNMMFVAGGLERAAIANALEVLFQNDRLHIEAHLLPRNAETGTVSGGLGSGRDSRDAERLAFPLLLERPWFDGELQIARWAAGVALNAPFTVGAFPIQPSAVASSIDHTHNPFLVLNHKRFSVLNGLLNYLTALPPWNLALAIQTNRQLQHLDELASYEGMMSSYGKHPNFENDALNLKWKCLFWRAGIIATRARAGHKAKKINIIS